MKILFKLLSFFIISLLFIIDSYAINAPINLESNLTNETSINLTWDNTENAYMYYISYGKESGEVSDYEFESDFVETNSIEINGLEKGNTYYFVVTALDENGDESTFSNEIYLDLPEEEIIVNKFTLDGVEVISSVEIELSFSNELDETEGTEREFKIYNKEDNFDLFDTLSVDLNLEDKTKLNITLDKELELGVDYEIVVIAIKDINFSNIESGIDSIESFIYNGENTVTSTNNTSIEISEDNTSIVTEGGTIIETSEDNTSIVTEEGTMIETSELNLNSASNEELEGNGPSGANVELSDINNTTYGAASNSSELPKTGPEHVLMFILSIILGALIFVFKYKKA